MNTRFYGNLQLIDNQGNIVNTAPCNHHPEYYNLIMEGVEISSRKNNDYCGDSQNSDPLKNFKAVEAFGLDPRQALFTRMLDKMQRIATYLQKGELQVKGEGFKDACSDLSNYALLLHALNCDIETKNTISKSEVDYVNKVIREQSKDVDWEQDTLKETAAFITGKVLREINPSNIKPVVIQQLVEEYLRSGE